MKKNKVRFGIVGTNFISDWVINGGKQDERFEVTAVYSRKKETAEVFAARHHIPHIFTSLEEMAQSPEVDAVYIASPNFLHASQSILCMSCGKHVLCEKPLASNAREARAMAEASRTHGVTLMEAMKSTLSPNFAVLMHNLHRIGVARRYFASYCQYSSRYDKLKEGIVLNAFNPSMSNGAMMDIGIYTLYPLVVLFGKPQRVEATGILLPTGADGQGAVNLQYSGLNATILYSKIADSYLPSEIQGEAGNLLINRINHVDKVEYIPRQGATSGQGQPPAPENLSVQTDKDGYYYEIKEFIDLVTSGRKESAINSHQNSIVTLEIIDEIRRQLGVVYPADSH